MSDHHGEPGWWQASDGKWYPPAQQPPSAALPPPSTPSTPSTPSPPSRPVDAAPPTGPSRNLVLLLIGVGVIVALLLAAVLVTMLTRDDSTESQVVPTTPLGPVSSTEPMEETTPFSTDVPDTTAGDGSIVGDSDVVGDVGLCTVVDGETILVDVTNSSSEQSDFTITMNFFDADGKRVGDEPFFVSYVQPGQRAIEESYSFEAENPDVATCEVAEVERYASPPSDDTSEITCEVTGLDFADDIEVGIAVTNNGTDTADYSMTLAIIRDDIRIGTAFGSIENVTSGQEAPGDAFSFVPGPVAGATCDVVSVSRTASE